MLSLLALLRPVSIPVNPKSDFQCARIKVLFFCVSDPPGRFGLYALDPLSVIYLRELPGLAALRVHTGSDDYPMTEKRPDWRRTASDGDCGGQHRQYITYAVIPDKREIEQM